MNSPGADKDWIKPLLAQNLERVEAPPELWNRVQTPPPVTGLRSSSPAFVWAAATGLLLVVTAAVAWKIHARLDGTLSNEVLAAKELQRGSENIEFRSDKAEEIQAWIKGRTDLDIPLLPEPAGSIRLVGASVAAWQPVPTAEVVYRVGDREEVLLVAKADPKLSGNASHRFLSSGQYHGARVSSWLMRGQLCTLACPISQNPQTACLLCHATGAPKIVLN
jgi:hypothetical protein